MPNTVIALKKSATPLATPVSLANGELAINYADGKLYYKHANGTIAAIQSGSGSASDSFGTVNAAGTLIIADTAGDILTLESGSSISITGDAINDKITIAADISPALIQANTARDQANTAFLGANAALIQANTARNQGNTAFLGANAALIQANTARDQANTALTTGQAAFGKANTALPNTSGASFSGNLNFPTGNVGIGTSSPASPTKLDVRGVIQGQSYVLPNDLGVAQWVKLGTLTIPQGGYTARIRMYMHQGYNAVNTQDFYTDIFFKTSNASSVDGNGFSGNSWYYSHGFNLANITPKWVGNAAGVSASAYDLYINVPAYIQNSHYIVEIVEGVNWTHLGTLGQVDPGSGSSTVCISSVGYNITLGNVGIGRTDPGYKLDIVGTANVSNMLVNGNMVFTTANDGTGSNLDADLLDGQHGSYYGIATDVTAAFAQANTARTQANTAFLGANAALIQANTARDQGNTAFTQANTARDQGNTAFTQATAAFTSSNAVNTYSNSTYVKLTAVSQTITGNLNIVGDLTLSGNTFVIDATRLEVDDPLIYLAANNYTSDLVDIGFIANYVNATGQNVHTGLYREHVDKEYYLFNGYDKEPANNHIGALSNNMILAMLNADLRTSNLILGGANAILTIGAAFNKANAALANTSGITFDGILKVSNNVSTQGLNVTSNVINFGSAMSILPNGMIMIYGDINMLT